MDLTAAADFNQLGSDIVTDRMSKTTLCSFSTKPSDRPVERLFSCMTHTLSFRDDLPNKFEKRPYFNCQLKKEMSSVIRGFLIGGDIAQSH